MLHNGTTWLTSPANTKYHLNIEGGLLQHSVGVTETVLRIKEVLSPDISDESCIIAGLFHDVGKAGMPGKPYYVSEVRDGVATGNYYINQELVAMGLSLRSLYLFSQYIPLTDEEAQALHIMMGCMCLKRGRFRIGNSRCCCTGRICGLRR